MRRFLVPLVLVGLLLVACGDDGGEDESFPEPDTNGAPSDGLPDRVVVFTPADSETDTNGEDVTWTPDVDDVLAVEAVLVELLQEEADTGVGALDTYARQYLGVGADEDLVSVNALCESSLETLSDWEDQLIGVADGGDCFWQATVDPQSGEVVRFTVNGVA